MFVCPIPISFPPDPPVEVLVWASDPKLDMNIEFCGYTANGTPLKCECTEEEEEQQEVETEVT